MKRSALALLLIPAFAALATGQEPPGTRLPQMAVDSCHWSVAAPVSPTAAPIYHCQGPFVAHFGNVTLVADDADLHGDSRTLDLHGNVRLTIPK
jgi:hypothetical protein